MENGFADIAKTLIENGAYVNVRGKLHWNMTPLLLAAQNCHEEVIRLLLSNGAGIKVRTEFGETAHSLAKDCENKEILRLFAGTKRR